MGDNAPDPPYWAVVFTSERRANGKDGYDAVAARMVELARAQPGCLGVESARGADGVGITVSYWASPEAIRNWRDHPEHAATRRRAGEWYRRYRINICRVERGHGFPD